ncbi:MAG: coat protein/nuclear export [Circular genetic element sp.]|nr:MAG: coat protein/nuclear export [Circular genetic element sp.]
MSLRRQNAFKGKAGYAASKRRNAAITLQRAARARATTSRRMAGFPEPLASTNPQGSLEVKSAQYANVSQTPSALAGTSNHVNAIVQGAGANNRLGNRYRCKAVAVRGLVTRGNATSGVVGYYLIWDKQPNQALAAADKIFTIDAANGLYPYNSGLNRGRKHRFQILAKYCVTVGDTQSNLPQMVPVNSYHKLPASCITSCEQGMTSGSISNIDTGALILIPFSNATVAGAEPHTHLAWELYFEEA